MTIKDKLLEPYQIHFDGSQYTVGKLVYSPKWNKDSFQAISYNISLESALKKVTNLKVSDSEDSLTILEYVELYKKMLNSFTEKIAV
jgi:hypothetical protein